MRQSWNRSVKFWQRYENQQILVIQCISPSKPVRFASFLFHWMRKRNIRTLLYYNFLWMSAILMWKMESTLDIAWSHSWELNWTQPESWGGKMSEAVASSNIFKWTQLTPRHWVLEKHQKRLLLAMYSNGPGYLYFRASLGRFHRTISCTHLRTQCTRLRMY